MSIKLRVKITTITLVALASPAFADVVTDWNETAVSLVTPRATPPAAQRMVAMVQVAMFDALNSIERRYRPYLVQLPARPTTSKEAVATAAAGVVLRGLLPNTDGKLEQVLTAYFATIPEGEAKAEGTKLGEAVGAKVLATRANDGASAADAYRPRTAPGVYVPTPITVGSTWPNVTPFALTSPSQFRPQPPIPLKSEQWATDYNEIKDLGGRTSVKRSAKQTEDARFWLITGPQSTDPIVRQLVAAKKMSVIDSARFMALVSVALADAYIAVLDAKYHYNFWRPITAIRNGDIDENSATERDASWQPIDNTPMHPEYPCAHCIGSAALVAVVEAVLGSADVPEVAMTSSTAPGVTHRWSNLHAFADEVANARIWAGFHYRFSARVGQEMGRKIGQHAAGSVMQPVAVANSR